MQDQHFTKIFWFLVSVVGLAIIYIFCITFIAIPKDNVRFADTAQGFFLGTIIGSVIAYFVGSSPPQKRGDGQPGATTADITASITTAPKETEQ